MTHKQIAFCRAYFENPVGVDTARRAGYSEKTARQIAWKIKHKSKINLDTLFHAYTILTIPGWRWDIDGRILPPKETAAAHKAFLKTAILPACFIDDINNGRYKEREKP
jgi:hypothetical protein